MQGARFVQKIGFAFQCETVLRSEYLSMTLINAEINRSRHQWCTAVKNEHVRLWGLYMHSRKFRIMLLDSSSVASNLIMSPLSFIACTGSLSI